ncbi:2Fe-2S iron-sulfur cluster-binding protein [Tuwongella immobilis]|uniref:2Fe-2S ferredoxin-type domain-containing protein n=1 Tax=Tuwongella immobilis TaxID=692036 RepID=A0A6C2YJN5_9BACT|nr:2Fe-2S iron-sulfur cluster-binding protein [Tuwongella immobilis]VIP01439.1 ferredoxin : Ferredoxin OS=Isosphaera pallida (strain ATCC 43644 / DSM 9630 / IS1B) GN=Isop_2222 PE=4 SV=1: Fer2 [Tuwongella immobilis]VTR98409.1 ferredoxin : Ferredoxin OS=Isosphaera pallida (strain ATCC 43644 / DSM 9630 / IS1B) GN=Isop_2222 PE=4 SV=1: Fer2 [Tuwongella immobilis]
MKSIKLKPIDTTAHVITGASLLDGLLSKALKVEMACGGRGLCATCHVYVRQGQSKLSPQTQREMRTLGFIADTDQDSRLSCQCSVLDEGIVVEVPVGMYLKSAEELMQYIGEEADKDFRHAITGQVMIPKGKLITRTMLKICNDIAADLKKLQQD